MKKILLSAFAALALTALLPNETFAQLPRNPRSQLPQNFQAIKQTEYNQMPIQEVTFPDFYDVEVNRFYHEDAIRIDPTLVYPVNPNPRPTMCGNGDFEAGLSTVEWQGGYGSVNSGGAVMYGTFAAGIAGGAINLATSRQTLVSTGTDPNVPINMVAPTGSTNAVRIGNAVNGNGAELLSKTFVVPSGGSIVTFWYALVLQDPGHVAADQPGFRVRVLDASGNELLGTVDLGNGKDSAYADMTNPFFRKNANGTIAYRDWSCAQINLTKYVGSKVTVQFVTKDCSQGGHFGYAYIDDFCGTCDKNPYKLELGNVDCSKTSICFNYLLPQQSGTTGTVKISLNIYQNGTLLTTMTSPVLSSGSSYCFNFTPGSIPGINPGLGYDYTAVGNFTLGGSALSPFYLFTPPDGHVPGLNNDCDVTPVKQCCPGTNLLINGGFESGNTGFTSGYTYQPAIAAGSVTPGQYATLTDVQALTVSSSWNANCAGYNRHLIVNGMTGGTSRLVWRQIVNVKPGNTYKFCGDFKNLPQCGFDIKPKVAVQIINAPGQSVVLSASNAASINLPNVACNWQTLDQTFTVPVGLTAVQISVILDESSIGDGNDLAADNFSLVELAPVPTSLTSFSFTPYNVTGSTYNVSAAAISPIAGDCSHFWEVEEMDASYNVISTTQVINPAAWQPLATNTFIGYVGTSTLSGGAAGVFSLNKIYRFIYGRSCTCNAVSKRFMIYGPMAARGVPGGNSQSGPHLLASGILDEETAPTRISTDASNGKPVIKVFPNPTDNFIVIQKPAAESDVTIKLFNGNGQLVKKLAAKGTDTRVEVSLSEFVSGTYLLQVVSDKGDILHTEKISKL